MNSGHLLDSFGKAIIQNVRDVVIGEFEATVAGSLRSPRAQQLHERLQIFDETELALVRDAVIQSVDDVLHYILALLEQVERLDVIFKSDENSTPQSVRAASDGLPGELYSEDGWIYRFSRYKENYG